MVVSDNLMELLHLMLSPPDTTTCKMDLLAKVIDEGVAILKYHFSKQCELHGHCSSDVQNLCLPEPRLSIIEPNQELQHYSTNKGYCQQHPEVKSSQGTEHYQTPKEVTAVSQLLPEKLHVYFSEPM